MLAKEGFNKCGCFSEAKTDRDPRRDDQTGVIACGFCGFENGTARISVLIGTNGTIISLGAGSEKATGLEYTGLGTLMAQE